MSGGSDVTSDAIVISLTVRFVPAHHKCSFEYYRRTIQISHELIFDWEDVYW